MQFTETARRGYENMFASMVIFPNRKASAHTIAMRLISNKSRYAVVEAKTNVPWWWIAIIHSLEADCNFKCHLHNGDLLTARTHHVPSGRPVTGEPPFSWEFSAEDALRMRGLEKVTDWSVPHALFEAEGYNGWGYTTHGVNSPYLWSFSNQYSKGKYVSDGKWDASAVSTQCGAAVLLRTLMDLGVVSGSAHLAEAPVPAQPKA